MSATSLRIITLDTTFRDETCMLNLEPHCYKRKELKPTFEFSFVPHLPPSFQLKMINEKTYSVVNSPDGNLLDLFLKSIEKSLIATFTTLEGRVVMTRPTLADWQRFYTVKLIEAPLGLQIQIDRIPMPEKPRTSSFTLKDIFTKI